MMCEKIELDHGSDHAQEMNVSGGWFYRLRECFIRASWYGRPRKKLSAQFIRKDCSDFSGKYGSSYLGRLPSFLTLV
jgi:hypothetical protein